MRRGYYKIPHPCAHCGARTLSAAYADDGGKFPACCDDHGAEFAASLEKQRASLRAQCAAIPTHVPLPLPRYCRGCANLLPPGHHGLCPSCLTPRTT